MLLLTACSPTLTAETFSADLFDAQCELDLCSGAVTDAVDCGPYVQPRAEDCAFVPDLGEACLDAAWATVDDCSATPDALPSACDRVCSDLEP